MKTLEQIALEAADEMRLTGIHDADLAEFLRLAIAKLTENVEPVAEVVWHDPQLDILMETKPSKIIDGSLSFMDHAQLGDKLYPASAIIALQNEVDKLKAHQCTPVCVFHEGDKLAAAREQGRQEAAEACAKLVAPSREHRANPNCYLGEGAGLELLDNVTGQIRDNQWRKYLEEEK